MGPQECILDSLLRYPEFIASSHQSRAVSRLGWLVFRLTLAAEMRHEAESH